MNSRRKKNIDTKKSEYCTGRMLLCSSPVFRTDSWNKDTTKTVFFYDCFNGIGLLSYFNLRLVLLTSMIVNWCTAINSTKIVN